MTSFKTLSQQHSMDLAQAIEPSLNDFCLNKEQLQQLQLKKLRATLAFAKTHSPWYQKQLHHIDSQTFTFQDISSLPVLTKEDVMKNWNELITTDELDLKQVKRHLRLMHEDESINPYFKQRFLIQASGGSSGNPIVMAYAWHEWIQLYLGFIRPGILAYQSNNSQEPQPQDAVIHTATLGTNKQTHMSCLLAKTFDTPQLVNHRFDSLQPIEQIAAKLNQIQPSFLSGYASMLYQMARLALTGKLTIKPIKVFSSTEPLYPYMAQAIEQAWGTQPGNSYVTTESGCIAWSCPQSNVMHVNEDMHYLEAQSDGSLLVTNLVNNTLPLIRYHISDMVSFSKNPCICGSPHATITEVGGRLSDQFHYSSKVIIAPKLFLRLLTPVKELADFQVKQTRHGVDIKVASSIPIDTTTLANKCRAMLTDNGLSQPQVTIEHVEKITTTAIGKSPKFIAITN